jgi:ubiquinone biosynthesis protein Coq4
MRFFHFAKILWGGLRMAINPESTNAVFDIGDGLYKLKLTEFARLRVLQDAENVRVMQEKPWIERFDLDGLCKLPEGTLGRCFATHMRKNNLDPYFYRTRKIENDTTYFIMRMRQTHDLWHVVTGFSTEVPGEIALQAFMIAQTQAALSPILLGGAFFRVGLKEPQRLIPMMEAIVKGYQLGKKMRPLFAVDWDAEWGTPLAELRERLNFSQTG